jgi:hypothetical protein
MAVRRGKLSTDQPDVECDEDLTIVPVLASRAATPISGWEPLDEFAASVGLSEVLNEARAQLEQKPDDEVLGAGEGWEPTTGGERGRPRLRG